MGAVATETKTQEAYVRIKKWLATGGVQPGERLPESKVCKELGLRRAAVREALFRLHGEGLLRKDGAYRAHVFEFTEDIPPEQLVNRSEVREQIAGGACRVAAMNMNGWQIEQLRMFAKAIDDSRPVAGCAARQEANFLFHEFLMENCGNKLLREIWESNHLMPSLPRSIALEQEILARVGSQNEPSLCEIVDAIATHDQDRAEAVMKKRVRKITEAIRATILHPLLPSPPLDSDANPKNGHLEGSPLKVSLSESESMD